MPRGAMGGGGADRVGTGLVFTEDCALEVVVDVGEATEEFVMGTSGVLRDTDDCKIGPEISKFRKLLLLGSAAPLVKDPPFPFEAGGNGEGLLLAESRSWSPSGEAMGAAGVGETTSLESGSSIWQMTASEVRALGSRDQVGVTMVAEVAFEVA